MHGREQVLWMSARCGAARCVFAQGGRPAACFRNISSAAKRRPGSLFFVSALRAPAPAPRLAQTLGLRSAAHFLFFLAAPLRLRVLVRLLPSSILREKVPRFARKSGSGRARRGSMPIFFANVARPSPVLLGAKLPGRTAPGTRG
jgi:hypothetical protein